MNKTYVIQWKSKVNGRAGRGTKILEKEEAERLVEELNREYPQIHHALAELQTELKQDQRTVAAPGELLSVL